MKVVWTEQAWRRLSEIEEFVARDRPTAAAKLVDKLIDRGDGLASHADRGRKLPESPGSDLRERVADHYPIVHRKTASTVEILTVFEGHRLLRPEALRGPVGHDGIDLVSLEEPGEEVYPRKAGVPPIHAVLRIEVPRGE